MSAMKVQVLTHIKDVLKIWFSNDILNSSGFFCAFLNFSHEANSVLSTLSVL